MRKQSTGLFTVKSASTFEFRGSSPSALKQNKKDTRRCLFVLAGAEGLEPSARGFGGTVEVSKKLIAMPFLSRFCTLARTLKSF